MNAAMLFSFVVSAFVKGMLLSPRMSQALVIEPKDLGFSISSPGSISASSPGKNETVEIIVTAITELVRFTAAKTAANGFSLAYPEPNVRNALFFCGSDFSRDMTICLPLEGHDESKPVADTYYIILVFTIGS